MTALAKSGRGLEFRLAQIRRDGELDGPQSSVEIVVTTPQL